MRRASEKPHTAAATISVRTRVGAYSETRAIAFGMAPPKPSPVRKRSTSSTSREGANAVHRVSSP